ncbi:uncharacterized protein LOC123506350 isoform X2 [Portunus trituberculatus]|uniref:uncharacterized protein LOC123506350 isoform X2 n=1 Tax=Portunus trituberculatus TaxID=210409 RepID=UPI001E1CB61C|nr:uncharacterized protein LOC123506350 isoform X2 [Portunus trituberculatus]XP_045114312.1 uncharacterized protein LOC123506350 isoform X2 [Portunus trituberculatus]
MNHLTWSSHNSVIWEVANKLLEDGVQVDVYLHTAVRGASTVEGQHTTIIPKQTTRKKNSHKDSISFPAHKLILGAASPFLRKVLNEHYLEHRDACVDITIPHVVPEALHCILNFLYCGSTGVPPGIRKSVLEAANLLQIKDFADYYLSSMKLEGLIEQENSVSQENLIEPEMKKTSEISHQRKGRKRNRSSDKQSVDSQDSKAAVHGKEKIGSGQDSGIVGGVGGRRRRKIKSRYSADIYEVNLPKMRKWKRRKLPGLIKIEKEASVQYPGKTQPSDVSLQPQKHAVPSLTSLIMETDKKCENELTNDKTQPSDVSLQPQKHAVPSLTSLIMETDKKCENELTNDSDTAKNHFTAPSLPPPLTPFNDSSSFTGKENKSPTPQLPLALVSSSSTVIIPSIFVPDQPYLSDTATKSEALAEMSCPSAIVQEDSVDINERPLEPSTMAIGSSPPPSLLSEVKELPMMSPSSSLASFPLKQVTSLTHHHKISDTLHDDKTEEEEQEDGLFKFQALLKGCEDFPDEVCPVSQSSQGGRGGSSAEKYQPGRDSVDINQWISEEIQSCIIPTTSDCNKESSQCGTSVEESKTEDTVEEIGMENKTLDFIGDKNKSMVECEHCGKKFSDQRSCHSHIRGVHDEARQMCRYCGKMFRRRCDLYQHERRHRTANLPCKYCDKIFKVGKDLQAHIATHEGGKRFHCSHCDKELTSYRNLKNHIASIHQKERPFACQQCKKTYSKASSLQVHIRSVHTGERPFECSVCDKTFCNAALLKNHQVVHTGEKKYCCKVCGRPFSQYSNMVSHQRIHTNSRPFLCHICSEDFKTKEALLKHKWVHTGLKPLRCRHCFREFRIKERYERHMLKCHNEVTSLPEIYFEVTSDMVKEESSNSPYCDIKVIGTAGEEEHFENTTQSQMLDDQLVDGGPASDLGPVVHLVSNIAEQEVASGEAGHVQLSYPLLTSTTTLEEGSSITLGSIAGQISCDAHVEPIDVGCLLNNEDTPSGDALIIAREGKAEVLPATIHDSAVADCEEVVILTKVSEDTGEMSRPQSTIKIWIPSDERAELEPQDGEGTRRGDILIVSNPTFAETNQTQQVLDPEISPQAVHTMILETSNSSLQ